LVDQPRDFGSALARALDVLSDDERAAHMAGACRDWARCFSWDRSAELMAGVVLHEMGRTTARSGRLRERRNATSDLAVLARFRLPEAGRHLRSLRTTDQVVADGDRVSALLSACDEFDAAQVLQRFGARDASLRLAERHELLSGPDALFPSDRADTMSKAAAPA
jgi:hypothetical protein